ncbi:MAG: hypothetical protein WB560_11065, partial [Desulfobaccales bacterium]
EVPEAAPTAENWQAFLQYVQEKEGGPLYGKLSQCRLLGIEDHRLRVAPGRTWNAVGRAHEARLQELARAFFGDRYALEILAPELRTSGKRAAAAAKTFNMTELKQQALEVFGGAFISPGKEEPD